MENVPTVSALLTGCVLPVRQNAGGSVMPSDLTSRALLCDGIIPCCRVCRCVVVASNCLVYVFCRILLNNIIKKRL